MFQFLEKMSLRSYGYDFSFLAFIRESKKKTVIEDCGHLLVCNPLSSMWMLEWAIPAHAHEPTTSCNYNFSLMSAKSYTEQTRVRGSYVNGVVSGIFNNMPVSGNGHYIYFMSLENQNPRIRFESYRTPEVVEQNRVHKPLSAYLCKVIELCMRSALSFENVEKTYDYFYWRVEDVYNDMYKDLSNEKKTYQRIDKELSDMINFGKKHIIQITEQPSTKPFDHAPFTLLLRLSSEKMVPEKLRDVSMQALSLIGNEYDAQLLKLLRERDRPVTDLDLQCRPSIRAVNSLLSELSQIATRDSSLKLASVGCSLSQELEHWISEVQSEDQPTTIHSHDVDQTSSKQVPYLRNGTASRAINGGFDE